MVDIIPLEYEYCNQVYEIAKASLPEHWSLDGIRDVLRYDNNIYYVAVVNEEDPVEGAIFDNMPERQGNSGKVAGFGGIMIVADEAELLNIAVEEDYRKEGIASAILDKLLESAKTAGCRRMLLEVRSANVTAQHLYMKKDFSQIGIRKGYYNNPSDDAVIMENSL